MKSRSSLGVVVVAVIASLVLPALVYGQSASPEVPAASPALPGRELPHPAHIHKGTCEELGEIVAPLTDVTPIAPRGPAPNVGASLTTVDLSLADILAAPHALMTHESAERIGNFIACADLERRTDREHIVVALAEVNDSGYVGAAFVHRLGGGQADVYLTLVGPERPVASPTEIGISDFAFDPTALAVPVGATVTWVNDGPSTHTVTANGGSFDSGNLAQGGTFSQTFSESGEFPYHCSIHEGMAGTIIVQ
jgi:plastocyanin